MADLKSLAAAASTAATAAKPPRARTKPVADAKKATGKVDNTAPAKKMIAGPPPGTKRTTFDLPIEDHRALRVTCLQEGTAAAHVVRVLIRRFLNDATLRAEVVDEAITDHDAQ